MAEVDGQHILFSGCAVARAMPPVPFAPSGQVPRRATIALARALHIGLLEAPHAGCCGARADLRVGEEARQKALAPLVEAAQRGLDIACLSPACRRVVSGYVPDAGTTGPAAAGTDAAQTTSAGSGVAVADLAPTTAVHVRDVVGLLTHSYDLGRLAGAATNPLSGLRVALHGTCHADHNVAVKSQEAEEETTPRRTGLAALVGARLSRSRPRRPPETVVRVGEPANPVAVAALGRLVRAIGADDAGDASPGGQCARHGLLVGLVGRVLGDKGSAPCLEVAARSGVDVMVTPCFLCYLGLNTYQRSLPRGAPGRGVPVLHVSQLVGLACDVAPGQLGLERTSVSARRILQPFLV